MNRGTLRVFVAKWMMEIILLALCAGLSIARPNFLSVGNLLNILQSVQMVGIVAFGMTMVIIMKEIDLSVGSAVAFTGCLLGFLTAKGLPLWLGIPMTLAAGALSGAFAGLMRVVFQVPSFITTLGLFIALRGFALMLTDGFAITPFPQWFSVFGGSALVVPFPTLALLAVFASVHFLMCHTTFGAAIYAIGGNDEAARLSGIRVSGVRVLVFAITGGLAALSGVLTTSRIMSASPSVGQNYELDAIAAVIIGGTSFSGGVGTVWGTLIGLVFIGVIINGMTLLNVGIYPQYVIRGILIFAAVLINKMQEERK